MYIFYWIFRKSTTTLSFVLIRIIIPVWKNTCEAIDIIFRQTKLG